jgi:cupin fold WbuC family metalloprotein
MNTCYGGTQTFKSMGKIQVGDLTLTPCAAGKSAAYFCEDSLIEISADTLNALKGLREKCEQPQIRLNLHGSLAETLQEMLIVQSRMGSYPAHKHTEKDESYQILEGALLVEIFDDSGAVVKSVELNPSKQNAPFLFRVKKNQWHKTTPRTDIVIFKESRPGPFEGGDSVSPPWAAP